MSSLESAKSFAAMLDEPLSRCREILVQYADESSHGPGQVWEKLGATGFREPVTSADVAVDAVLNQTLTQIDSHSEYLSEESWRGADELPKNCWIVDPVDGTALLASGSPLYTISVALQHEGSLIAAALDFPAFRFRLTAVRGFGLHIDGDSTALAAAVSGEILVSPRLVRQMRMRLQSLDYPRDKEKVAVRGVPTASIKIASVALRFARSAIAPVGSRGSMCWDIAAATVIAHESGVRITDASGRQIGENTVAWWVPTWLASTVTPTEAEKFLMHCLVRHTSMTTEPG